MKRFFPTQQQLSDADIRQGLSTVVKDGVTSYIMITLIGGAFLTDYALKLGAGNLAIGFISSILVLANLLQVPAIAMVEHYRNRRALAVIATAMARLGLLGLAVIPWFQPQAFGLPILLASLTLYALLAAIGVCAWNSWMRDLIPMRCLGSFMARRMAIGTLISMLFGLAAGFGIDAWKVHHPDQILWGYALICLVGAAAGLLGIYFISQIPEPEMAPPTSAAGDYKKILIPFQDANFKNLIWFLGSLNFALNLAIPFFSAYMLKYLGLPLSTVMVLTVLQQLVYIVSLRLWGRLTDRFSSKTVLSLCTPLYLICIFGWTYTTMPSLKIWALPLLCLLQILQGAANSGVLLGSYNISLKLAPRGEATTYLAAVSIVNSLAAGLAPLLSGSLVDLFRHQQLVLNLHWSRIQSIVDLSILDFQYWDFFFAIAVLLGCFSLYRLNRVQEGNAVSKEALWREITSEIRESRDRLYDSLGVLRLVYHWPFAFLNNLLKRKNQRQACNEKPSRDTTGR